MARYHIDGNDKVEECHDLDCDIYNAWHYDDEATAKSVKKAFDEYLKCSSTSQYEYIEKSDNPPFLRTFFMWITDYEPEQIDYCDFADAIEFKALIKNPNTPMDIVHTIIGWGIPNINTVSNAADTILSQTKYPEARFREFCKYDKIIDDASLFIKKNIAKNKWLTSEGINSFIRSSESAVRLSVLDNESISDNAVKLMVCDSNIEVALKAVNLYSKRTGIEQSTLLDYEKILTKAIRDWDTNPQELLSLIEDKYVFQNYSDGILKSFIHEFECEKDVWNSDFIDLDYDYKRYILKFFDALLRFTEQPRITMKQRSIIAQIITQLKGAPFGLRSKCLRNIAEVSDDIDLLKKLSSDNDDNVAILAETRLRELGLNTLSDEQLISKINGESYDWEITDSLIQSCEYVGIDVVVEALHRHITCPMDFWYDEFSDETYISDWDSKQYNWYISRIGNHYYKPYQVPWCIVAENPDLLRAYEIKYGKFPEDMKSM